MAGSGIDHVGRTLRRMCRVPEPAPTDAPPGRSILADGRGPVVAPAPLR
jgi:hypothetical protein